MSNKNRRGGRQKGPDARIKSSYIYTEILERLKKEVLQKRDVTFSLAVNKALASLIEDDALRSEFSEKVTTEGSSAEYFQKFGYIIDQIEFGFLAHFAASGYQNTIELIRYKHLELQDAKLMLDNALEWGYSFEKAKNLADCISYYEQDIARLQKEIEAFDKHTLPEDSFFDRVMSALVHEMQWMHEKNIADIRQKTGLSPDGSETGEASEG